MPFIYFITLFFFLITIKYLYSMYWACVTMMTVGYGDIAPQNEVEMIVCMIAVVLGCAVMPIT